MSTSNTPDSGILIAPLQRITFSGRTIYLRCIDGWAEARVVPFIVDSGGGSSSSDTQGGGSTVDDSQIITDEEVDQLLDDIFDQQRPLDECTRTQALKYIFGGNFKWQTLTLTTS